MGLYCEKSKIRLDGRTVIITGANTGIGKEAAKDLYKRGAHVILACRNMEKAEEAAKDIVESCKGLNDVGKLAVVQLNLSNLESVKVCSEKILERNERIDLLINNAGVMAVPYTKTDDGFEMHIGSNYFGHFLFTLLLLPRIIKSAPARIVNVSSMLHSDRRLKDANIKDVHVYSLHPGAIATDLQKHVDTTYNKGICCLLNVARRFFKTPLEGAQTTIYCSIDEK